MIVTYVKRVVTVFVGWMCVDSSRLVLCHHRPVLVLFSRLIHVCMTVGASRRPPEFPHNTASAPQQAASACTNIHVLQCARVTLLTIPVNDVAVTEALICMTSSGSVAGRTRVL